MTTTIPSVTLANGVKMPSIGFGVAGLDNGPELKAALNAALAEGYRMFDTAPFYGNEAETAQFLLESGIPREELFIVTKLPNACHAYEDTIRAVEESLERMKLDYLDMYLIHFPVPSVGKYCEAWRAMEKLYKDGKIRAIGVSNFQEKHLDTLLASCEIVPMTNELECNAYLTIKPLRKYCEEKNIRVINWFPLGGPSQPLVPYPVADFPILREEPIVNSIGEKYGKTPAQVLLRWAVDGGMVPIPKSCNPGRIHQNRDIFDFALTAEELEQIDSLNYDRRFGPDPDTFDDLTMG